MLADDVAGIVAKRLTTVIASIEHRAVHGGKRRIALGDRSRPAGRPGLKIAHLGTKARGQIRLELVEDEKRSVIAQHAEAGIGDRSTRSALDPRLPRPSGRPDDSRGR